MNPKLILRSAAIIMLLHVAGHTLAAFTWDEAPNQGIEGTLLQMKNNRFEFLGSTVNLALFMKDIVTP